MNNERRSRLLGAATGSVIAWLLLVAVGFSMYISAVCVLIAFVLTMLWILIVAVGGEA